MFALFDMFAEDHSRFWEIAAACSKGLHGIIPSLDRAHSEAYLPNVAVCGSSVAGLDLGHAACNALF